MSHYDLEATIGPCSKADAGALAQAILELPEAKAVHIGAIAIIELDAPRDPVTITVGARKENAA